MQENAVPSRCCVHISRREDRGNSPNLLGREDNVGVSYSVRRAGFPAYTSLTLALESQICSLETGAVSGFPPGGG